MNEPTAQDQVARLLTGFWTTQTIYVAAKLGIADCLRQGPQTAAELARLTQTHPDALYRLLRALASLGLFAEDDRQRFSLTPLANCLRSDVPGSLQPLAIMRGEWQYQAWGELLHSIQTGRPAFEKTHGMPLFDFLARHPDKGQIFDAAMTAVHGRETDAVLDAYDFAGIGTLVDVGGGNGSVLSAILKKHAAMKGIVFDVPEVIERTRKLIVTAGLTDRCQVQAGDFFHEVPAGADAYHLRHILHDWEDDRAIAILKNCRQAMPDHGRLLVVEGIIPSGNDPHPSKYFDLAMMVVPGGLERTETEYRRLFAAAGFRLDRIVPTRSWISVIEGVPT